MIFEGCDEKIFIFILLIYNEVKIIFKYFSCYAKRLRTPFIILQCRKQKDKVL